MTEVFEGEMVRLSSSAQALISSKFTDNSNSNSSRSTDDSAMEKSSANEVKMDDSEGHVLT